MSSENELKPKVALSLTGIMSQFSMALLFILAALSFLAYNFIDKLTGDLLNYSLMFTGLLLIASIICAFVFYLRQQNRPVNDSPSEFELKSSNGKLVKFVNPPDSVYSKEEIVSIMRSLTVSYDEKLCPSGEVLGHASENSFREFDEKEKIEFKKRHIEEINGKKNAIMDMYNHSNSIQYKSAREDDIIK